MYDGILCDMPYIRSREGNEYFMRLGELVLKMAEEVEATHTAPNYTKFVYRDRTIPGCISWSGKGTV